MNLLLIIITVLVVALALSILLLFKQHQNKVLLMNKDLNETKMAFDKILLESKLEIQEDTFRNISREIHDNIGLSLTLAKLNLNTLDWKNSDNAKEKVFLTTDLIGKAIKDLSSLSKSLNSDLILQNGLLGSLEEEFGRIKQLSLFELQESVSGIPVFLNSHNELIVFRIIQEAFNNIIKHAGATVVVFNLHYDLKEINISISDNGRGFATELIDKGRHSGITNMEARVKMLEGDIIIKSTESIGTEIVLSIPLSSKYEQA